MSGERLDTARNVPLLQPQMGSSLQAPLEGGLGRGEGFDLSLADLPLRHGGVVGSHRVRGWSWGPTGAAAAKARTVLLVHALTGDARAGGEGGWWAPLIGPGLPLDPSRVRIVCFNNLGSPYGSSGPTTGGWPNGARLSTEDQARSILLALDALGVERVDLAAGGSLGGMIVLWLAALAPERFVRIMPIAAAAAASAWLIGFNHVARQIIELGGDTRGLALARQLAMLTYRAEAGLELSNGRDAQVRTSGHFAIEGYLEHQGVKLTNRFDAASYLAQLDAMNAHDVRHALERIRSPALVVDVDSDRLYTSEQSDWLGKHLASAERATIHSAHGHDAFLIEWPQLASLVERALALKPRG